MRSKGDIDLCAVAKKFGGGGHKNASGCSVTGRYAEVRARIVARGHRGDRAGLDAGAGAVRRHYDARPRPCGRRRARHRQAVRTLVARRRRGGAARARRRQGRAHRHARSPGDWRSAAADRPRHAARPVLAGRHEDVRGARAVRLGHRHLRRRGRADWGRRHRSPSIGRRSSACSSGSAARFAQRPPAFSAKKVGGHRAYALARAARAVALEPVMVTVHELRLLELDGEHGHAGGHELGRLLRALARPRSRRRAGHAALTWPACGAPGAGSSTCRTPCRSGWRSRSPESALERLVPMGALLGHLPACRLERGGSCAGSHHGRDIEPAAPAGPAAPGGAEPGSPARSGPARWWPLAVVGGQPSALCTRLWF